jgi:hypothetical protein
LTDQLGLLTPLNAREFIKVHGHSMTAVFFALTVKSLMGTVSMNDFEKEVNDSEFLRNIAGFTRKLGKTVLGRNMKRFKPAFLHGTYYTVMNKLVELDIITLRHVAIDSTFIEVTGKGYQKTARGWGKKKTALGYRLSVAFDLDSKLPVAYILTAGNKHDSQFLTPLIEIIKSKYGVVPERVVMDRAYYGHGWFTYLTENGVELVTPLKKYANIKETFEKLDSKDFQYDKDLKIQYSDGYIAINGYGILRVIWLVNDQVEEWMPEDLENGEWWGLLTNRVDHVPADVIRAYKDRWEIEVFFRSTKQRMALDKLPGRDFRQVQAHVFFVFIGYMLLMLVRHLVPLDDGKITIGLKITQETVLFVKAIIVKKRNYVNLHFTAKDWLYYHEEVISLV